MKRLFKVNIHPTFRINGKNFSAIELNEFAYSYIKEGVAFEKDIGDFILDWIDVSPTLTVHTSGSTGIPKSIELEKEHMVNSALATGSYFGLTKSITALLCLPASYIAGKMMLVRAMVLGWDMYLVPPSSSPLDSVHRSFDFGAMVPLQVLGSLPALHQIKTLLVGGAPISKTLRDALMNIDNYCFETYGMTETISHIAVRPLNKLHGAVESIDVPFKTLPNIEVAKDERDCLVIMAPKVAKDVVVTNDIVDLFSSSEFKWLGRYDNCINAGGIKIHPEQIEAKLFTIIGQNFFIGSLPDVKLGEQVVLVVEGIIKDNNLIEKINSSTFLSKYELPKSIKSIPEFLRTKSGKIKRKETMSLLS